MLNASPSPAGESSADERRTVVVTGGAGFIGSHLTERLLQGGADVVVIDDCSTGTWKNLSKVTGHPRLRCVESTVSGYSDLPELMGRAAAVYHLAAAVGVDLVVKSPIRTIETNLRETETILQAASLHRVPLLLTSTSEVYGKSQKEGFAEADDLLIGPPHLGRWSYACSKLMDEFLALAYATERQLPVVIARLFNTVGPRQTGRYGMVLPRFVQSAKQGLPLRVFGDGSQSRCFCYVGDTVEALIRLMGSPAARGQVVNIGSRDEVSILDLAKTVVKAAKSKSAIEFVPYESAYAPGFEDMMRRRPEVERLHALTGFRPATTLETMIDQLLEEDGLD